MDSRILARSTPMSASCLGTRSVVNLLYLSIHNFALEEMRGVSLHMYFYKVQEEGPQ